MGGGEEAPGGRGQEGQREKERAEETKVGTSFISSAQTQGELKWILSPRQYVNWDNGPIVTFVSMLSHSREKTDKDLLPFPRGWTGLGSHRETELIKGLCLEEHLS